MAPKNKNKIFCAPSCSHLSFGKLYFIINFHIFGTCGYGHTFFVRAALYSPMRRVFDFHALALALGLHTHTRSLVHGDWLHHRICAGRQQQHHVAIRDRMIYTRIFIYLFIFEINNICRCAFSLSHCVSARARAQARNIASFCEIVFHFDCTGCHYKFSNSFFISCLLSLSFPFAGCWLLVSSFCVHAAPTRIILNYIFCLANICATMCWHFRFFRLRRRIAIECIQCNG